MNNFSRTFSRRFWDKVIVSDVAACWLWTGAKNQGGYGFIRRGGRGTTVILATRAMWLLIFGEPVPPEVCHDCPDGDNPSCVNPFHLWAGTHATNLADAAIKGRVKHGEDHYAALLDESEVRKLRAMRAVGATYRELAARFGVNFSTARDVVKGLTWKHI